MEPDTTGLPVAHGATPSTPAGGNANPLFLPVLWLALSVLGWLAFMSWQLWSERTQLEGARQSQEANMATAARIRQSLDAMAIQTARLADTGNVGAQAIVDELRKRGITINQASGAVSGK